MSRNEFTESQQINPAWEITSNVLVALFFLLFALSCAKASFPHFRLSILLIVLKETFDALFFLCRKIPKQVTIRFSSWASAIGGTVAPLMLRPSQTTDLAAGNLIQYLGLCLQIAAIFSLNRSFGIVPANRGIKRKGLYSLVRHPLYSSYTIALLGFVINNPSFYNIFLLLLATAFQIIRISREEAFLSQDEEYMEYTKKTKWRLVPFIF